MAHTLGGEVKSATNREYGKTLTRYNTSSLIFDGLSEESISWMSHTDYIARIPEGFRIIATTENCPVAAMGNPEKKIYGIQFHPEVNHTENGLKMLHNFV